MRKVLLGVMVLLVLIGGHTAFSKDKEREQSVWQMMQSTLMETTSEEEKVVVKGLFSQYYKGYVTGFRNGLLLAETERGIEIAEFLLKGLKGMSDDQCADTIIKFYEDNPQWRDQKTIFVMMAIPNMRAGKPYKPIIPEKEED